VSGKCEVGKLGNLICKTLCSSFSSSVEGNGNSSPSEAEVVYSAVGDPPRLRTWGFWSCVNSLTLSSCASKWTYFGQLGVEGIDFDAKRALEGGGEISFCSIGVPLGASGPPYLRAGLRISPDFFRMSFALYGDVLTLLARSLGELRGTIPVKSSFNAFSRRRGGTIGRDGAAALANVETVCKDASDRARTGCRRGMKLEGVVVDGPTMVEDDDAEEGDISASTKLGEGEGVRSEDG